MVVALPSVGRIPREPFQTHGFAVGYERSGIYPVDFVLANLNKLVDFDGDMPAFDRNREFWLTHNGKPVLSGICRESSRFHK